MAIQILPIIIPIGKLIGLACLKIPFLYLGALLFPRFVLGFMRGSAFHIVTPLIQNLYQLQLIDKSVVENINDNLQIVHAVRPLDRKESRGVIMDVIYDAWLEIRATPRNWVVWIRSRLN